MKNKLNPVFMSGIKSRMRGLRAPVLMCVYFAIVLGIFSMIYYSMSNTSYSFYNRPAAIGTELASTLYIVLVVIVFGVIVLMTPPMCAGAIAGERERQTLDLLLCSPMSARGIITGKLLSNLAFILFLLLLTLPLFTMVYLFGGSRISDMLLLLLYLVICAYACCSVSIFFSSLLKRSSLATILTYVALFLFVILTLIGGALAYNLYTSNYIGGSYPYDYVPFLLRINPIVALVEMLSSIGDNPNYYYFSLIGSQQYGNATLTSTIFMVAVSLLLNALSAAAIKPVQKFKLQQAK